MAHDSLHDALSTSVAHETVTLKCFNGYPFDAPESIVNPPELLVKHSSACYDGLNLATAVCGAAPDEVMNIVLIPAVEHELYQMGAFREMLKIHDDMMIAHGSIIIKLEKEAMGQNQSKIDDYKAKLIIAENDRSNFYKGLIYFTLPMHARHRGHAFRTAYSGMAAVTLMEASQAHTASLEFFSKMQVHPNTAADHCNTVLSSLKMGALNSTQMDLGRGATNFFDANIPVRPLLEGLFEAAISGDYGPLQTTNSSAPPAPPASFAPRCGENFSDNEDNNDRIPTEFAGASVQDTQGEWQGGGGESVGI